MKTFIRQLNKTIVLASLMFFSAQVSAGPVENYTVLPPTVVDATKPLVLLAMSRDNQLWHKAYTDYSDIDGDGEYDLNYLDTFDYYGYFNSNYCYTYSTARGLYTPSGTVSSGHKCVGACPENPSFHGQF
jgi:type IV pilus assembly protein PilY1